MAKQTILVRTTTENKYFSSEIKDTLTLQSSSNRVDENMLFLSLFSLCNTSSDKVVRISSVQCNSLSAGGSLSTTAASGDIGSKVQISKISSLTYSSDNVVNCKKMDSSNADLPSDILVVKQPIDNTKTGTIISEKMLGNYKQGGVLSMQFTNSCNDGDIGLGNMFRFKDSSSNQKQHIVLRYGEGIVINYGNMPFVGANFSFAITFRYNSNTYIVNEVLSTYANDYLALFNDRSGATIDIIKIEITQTESSYLIANPLVGVFVIQKIDGDYTDNNFGESLNIISLDSSQNVPSTIVAKKNAMVQIAGYKFGISSAYYPPALAIKNYLPINKFTNDSGDPPLPLFPLKVDMFGRLQDVDGIVLRQGEGISINARQYLYGNQEIIVTATIEDADTSIKGYTFVS